MHKKSLILLAGFLLLTACDNSTPDTETEETPEEINTEEIEKDDMASATHLFDELVDGTTFTEEYGLQAWEDYKAIVESISLAESTILNDENATADDLDGAPTSEVEGRFVDLDLRGDVFTDEVELSETEKMNFYRYPPEETSDYTEVADFLAEITFYYVSDNLMFSSVTPGFYTVEVDNLPSTQDLMAMVTVSEIEAIDPRIYTVAEMQVDGRRIQQVMTPAIHIDENGNEELMAFYLFADGEDLLQYAYIPFEMVSQDFPTNSVLLFYQIIPEIQGL